MSINSLQYVKVWESRNECGFDLPVTKKWRGRGRDFGWILVGGKSWNKKLISKVGDFSKAH
jgi:hypothetical protein